MVILVQWIANQVLVCGGQLVELKPGMSMYNTLFTSIADFVIRLQKSGTVRIVQAVSSCSYFC